MKKSFFHIALSALLLMACSTEPLPAPEWADTTFIVTTGAEPVKAPGDAFHVNRLTVLAYDKSGKYLENIVFRCTPIQDGFSASARLVRGVEYTLLFFAHEEQTYELRQDGILVLEEFGAVNDGYRDAFSAVEKVVGGESASLSVSLKRPFALLRIVSSRADQDEARAQGRTSGIRSRIVLKGVPNKINLLTGAVEGSVEAVFPEAPPASADELAFVFVPAGETKAFCDAVVTVQAGSFTAVRNLTNVPLQRNRQTKIEGDFLTTEGGLDINLDTD